MHPVRQDEARKGGGRRPVRAGRLPEPAPDADDRTPDDGESKGEADDAQVGEQLERDAVRLGHRRRALAVAAPRQRERARARAAEGSVGSDVERLAPPLEPVVRAQVGQPPRLVDALATRELEASPRVRIPDLGDETDRTDQDGQRAEADERRTDHAGALVQEPPDVETPGRKRDCEPAGDRERGEHLPVGHAIRAQGAVLDERGPREGPSRHEERREDRNAGARGVFQPLVREHEPEDQHGRRPDDARP